MQLSVIIPFHSRVDTLSACLKAIDDSYEELISEGGAVNFEVVIVNDASPMFPKIPISAYPIKVINLTTNQGVANARNQAIEAAIYERFLCLDSDVLIHRNFLPIMNLILSENPRHQVIQGVMTHQAGGSEESFFRIYLALSFAFDTYEYLNSTSHSELLCSGCFSSTKSLMKKIGMFDARFQGSGGEEFEILARIPKDSIYQDSRLMADHVYEAIWPRLRKVFKRSRYYLDVAVFNDSFPARLRFIGITRSVFSALATLSLLLIPKGPMLFILGYTLFMLLLTFADRGRQIRYIFNHSNWKVTLLTPFFIYVEYLAALSGLILSRIPLGRRNVE